MNTWFKKKKKTVITYKGIHAFKTSRKKKKKIIMKKHNIDFVYQKRVLKLFPNAIQYLRPCFLMLYKI